MEKQSFNADNRKGDDIDIDALVEAHADFASGREMSDYVYTRYRNLDRNIAVMFMVDMEWFNPRLGLTTQSANR